eukprot:1531882-Prorocentrum_lima.AAC.1
MSTLRRPQLSSTRQTEHLALIARQVQLERARLNEAILAEQALMPTEVDPYQAPSSDGEEL